MTEAEFDITENGKYYVPDPSEMHLGFEYEFNWEGVGAGGEWEKAVIKSGTQIDDIHRKYTNGLPVYDLRVKHLDHDDIISLGWSSDHQMDVYKRVWVINKYVLYMNSYRYVDISSFDEQNDIADYFFRGMILNKSELKRVMKQIGIK